MGDELCPRPLRGPPLPSRRWELSAPESYLLRYAGYAPAAPVFKLALMDLVARQALRVDAAWVRRRWRSRTQLVWLLGDGPRISAVTEPALAPLLALHTRLRETRVREGIATRDHAVALEGVPLSAYVKARTGRWASAVVAEAQASLQHRGLLAATRRTTAGDEADRELEAWLELGRTMFPRWSHHRPWARAYLRGGGAAILLVKDVYPMLAHVASEARAPDEPHEAADDAVNLLATLGDVLVAFDAGFAGDGSGGDRGGGDGTA